MNARDFKIGALSIRRACLAKAAVFGTFMVVSAIPAAAETELPLSALFPRATIPAINLEATQHGFEKELLPLALIVPDLHPGKAASDFFYADAGAQYGLDKRIIKVTASAGQSFLANALPQNEEEIFAIETSQFFASALPGWTSGF